MKKKSALFLVLAMASTATLGLAACDDGHEHSWQAKSNGDAHWQECECGDQKEYGLHVDVKNNESSAETPDGKCDVCGADVHVHAYTMKSDDDTHWQECAYGEKANIGAHVDVKNNESGADGMDGKCDTCGAVIKHVVSFNMNGHGVAPAALRVSHGGKATAPDAPMAQGFVFGGWFTDAACSATAAFNFEETTVSAATVLYAKWTEDTTPGKSEKYPKTLAFESEAEAMAFGAGNQKLYFTFTATASSRYALRLLSGAASQACTYTTDAIGDEATHDKTADYNFDLRKDETVTIEVARGEGVTDDAAVGVYVTKVTDEALPATGWASGTYTDDSDAYTLIFNRDTKQVKWLDNDEVSLSYVGGSIDKATFVVNNMTFTVTDDNGVFRVVSTALDEPLELRLPAGDPIPVEKFSGAYTVEEGGLTYNSSFGRIVEVGIYEDGTGYFMNASDNVETFSGEYAKYNPVKNVLKYSTYRITLTLDDAGDAESISVSNGTTTVVYTRVGNVSPLPTSVQGLENGATYAGSDAYFVFDGASTMIDSYQLKLLRYDEDANTYLARIGNDKVLLVLTGTGDDVVITVKDEMGENTLDTLTKFAVSAELPATTTSTEKTLAETDFKMGLYHMNVKADGWYTFTTEADVAFYVSTEYARDYLNTNVDDYNYTLLDVTAPVYLQAGRVVAVSPETVGALTFTVGKVTAPEGYSSETPKIKDGIGDINVGDTMQGIPYYARFTGLEDGGTYIVMISDDSWSGCIKDFTLNGKDATFASYYIQSASVTLTDTTTLDIMIYASNYYAYEGVKISVAKDYTVAANALTIDKPGRYDVTLFGLDEDTRRQKMTYVNVTATAPGYLISLDGKHFFTVDGTEYGYDENDEALANLVFSLAAGTTPTQIILGSQASDFTGGTATLIVEYDYTAGAKELSFTEIPMGSAILNFTNESVATSQNFKLNDTKEAEIYASAKGAFTINYPDGTKMVAKESGNGSYLAAIPATEGLYFNITAASSVDITFATSYGAGTMGNPMVLKFDGVTARQTFAPGDGAYYELAAGKYIFGSSAGSGGNIQLWINDDNHTVWIGDQFEVKDGDVVYIMLNNMVEESESAIITMLVPTAIQGEYFYGDDSITIGGNSLTLVSGDKSTVYAFSGFGENTYKFTYTTDDTVTTLTVTVSGDTLTCGSTTLIAKILPDDLVGTYEGSSDGYDYKLVIKKNYTADYTFGTDDPMTVTLKKGADDNHYSFTYMLDEEEWTCTIVVNSDGTITFTDSTFQPAMLTKQAETILNGTWSGVSNSRGTITLTITDGNQFSISFMGSAPSTGTLIKNGDTYSFTCVNSFDDPFSFTVNADGSINLVDEYNSNTLSVLTKS